MSDTPNRCAYCLQPFFGRGRCCSRWCARRVNGKVAWVTRSRREAVSTVMETIQRKARFIPTWRQISMGDDLQLQRVFGIQPDPTITPRHGETLDF